MISIQRCTSFSPCFWRAHSTQKKAAGEKGNYSNDNNNEFLDHILPIDTPNSGQPDCLQLPTATAVLLWHLRLFPSGPVGEFLWNIYTGVAVWGHEIHIQLILPWSGYISLHLHRCVPTSHISIYTLRILHHSDFYWSKKGDVLSPCCFNL